jgi:plasmid replication initiation protein
MKLSSFWKAILGIFIGRYRAKNPKAGEMLDIIQTVLDAENYRLFSKAQLLEKIDLAGKRAGLLPEERALLRAIAEERLIKLGIE